MWRLIPKLPIALLLAVFVLWRIDYVERSAREQTARLHLRGPLVPLHEGERGTWTIAWPEWPASKGEPLLCAYGLPYTPRGQRSPVELVFRVEPRDAVEFGKERHADEEGWFEAGSSSDWDTFATLDRAKAKHVEYFVRRAEGVGDREAQPFIEGTQDPYVLEAILVGQFVRDVLALLVGVPLLIWAVVAFVHRRREQHRNAALTPAA